MSWVRVPSFTPFNMYKLALLGGDVSKSLSPVIYKEFFNYFGFDYSYDLISLSPHDVYDVVTDLVKKGYNGFNVTNPYKRDIVAYSDIKSDNVSVYGTANVYSVNNGVISCCNTDGIGFRHHVSGLVDFSDKKVAILGCGGVVMPILSEVVALGGVVTVVVRNISKAEYLKSFDEDVSIISSADLSSFDIIINATGVSLRMLSSFVIGRVQPSSIYYDLSYSDTFIGIDAESYNGIGMLVHQAAFAMHFWTGLLPPDKLRVRIIDELI